MRLSEAIRLGVMALAPCKKKWFDYDSNGNITAGCVLATACYSLGVRSGLDMPRPFLEAWPWTLQKIKTEIHVRYEIDGWTREQIAEWVESIEPQEAESGVDDPNGMAVSLRPVNESEAVDPVQTSHSSPPLVRHAD